jgi:hypothetical protein
MSRTLGWDKRDGRRRRRRRGGEKEMRRRAEGEEKDDCGTTRGMVPFSACTVEDISHLRVSVQSCGSPMNSICK